MGTLNLKSIIMLTLLGTMTVSFAQENEIMVEDETPRIEESEGEEAPVMDESSDYSEEEY